MQVPSNAGGYELPSDSHFLPVFKRPKRSIEVRPQASHRRVPPRRQVQVEQQLDDDINEGVLNIVYQQHRKIKELEKKLHRAGQRVPPNRAVRVNDLEPDNNSGSEVDLAASYQALRMQPNQNPNGKKPRMKQPRIAMQVVDADENLGPDFQLVYKGGESKVKSMIDKLKKKIGTDDVLINRNEFTAP